MSLIESAIQRARTAAGRDPARQAAQSGQQARRAPKGGAGEASKAPTRQFQPIRPDSAIMERNCILPQIVDQSALRAYKILRTRVLQRMNSKQWHALAITGVDSGQGKTLTAINLAIALAQDPNTAVFLVDLDLQRPKIAEYMGLNFKHGLGEYLLGEASIDEIFYSPGIERLAVIPNSRIFDQSSDVLSGPRMLELVQRLNAEQPQRIVIYDMPPLLLSDDVLTFVPHNADGLLLVISEGATGRGLVEKSKDLLAEMNVIGVVLNRSMERNDSAYY
jgi:Mrp family chromosome partitioning ATPase